jgi:hypothetical protein
VKSHTLIYLFILGFAASLAAEDEPKLAHPTSFLETRQGHHPDGPDKIGHASVSKDDTLMCMSVEVYDETHQASTACVVKFKDGSKRTLASAQLLKIPEDGEVTLLCSGSVPRRCMIEVNDPVNQPPVRRAAR